MSEQDIKAKLVNILYQFQLESSNFFQQIAHYSKSWNSINNWISKIRLENQKREQFSDCYCNKTTGWFWQKYSPTRTNKNVKQDI